jgi:ribosomal protein S18 acetylase RimI-like enzyme
VTLAIRRATESDLPTLNELWRAFCDEAPVPPHVDLDLEQELREVAEIVRDEVALVAEEDGRAVGFALARPKSPRLARLSDLYVVPDARGRGVASALMQEVLAAFPDAEYVTLEVGAENGPARSLYARWGFVDDQLVLVAPRAELEHRLSGRPAGETFGSIHVQSDDAPAVERAVRQFVPRLPGRSRGSLLVPPRHGWIAVYDDACDRDSKQLHRLARELSDRMGCVVLAIGVEEGAVVRFALLDRGKVMDEYLSVQEYYGPLPPGDVVALAANPTVVARLTGADPGEVRAAAAHAAMPAELPPVRELASSIAATMGIEGVDHGWADAPEIPGAIRLDRA